MRAAAALAAALLAAGCGAEPASPEQQIAATLEAIERASRERDLEALRDFVSPSYRDRAGRTRQDVHGLIAFHTLRRQSVYLLTRIQHLELPAPDAAHLVVLAAMAGTPIGGVESLRDVRADVYRFELRLAREGGDTWRAVSADWRPGRLEDFGL